MNQNEEGSGDYKLTQSLKPKGGLKPNPSPLLLKKRDNYSERESLEETKKNKNSEVKEHATNETEKIKSLQVKIQS